MARLDDILIVGVLAGVLVMLVLFFTGCSSHQRQAVSTALNPESTYQAQGQYDDLKIELQAAEDIVKGHFRDMSQQDRVALSVAYTEYVRASAGFEQAISQDPIDADKLKAVIADGVKAYHQAKPILEKNHTMFTPDEWNVIVKANMSLISLNETAQALTKAEDLKEAAMIVWQAVKFAKDVAL